MVRPRATHIKHLAAIEEDWLDYEAELAQLPEDYEDWDPEELYYRGFIDVLTYACLAFVLEFLAPPPCTVCGGDLCVDPERGVPSGVGGAGWTVEPTDPTYPAW